MRFQFFLNSWVVPSYHMTRNTMLLHVIGARCVARDLHTIAPGLLECTCWRQFAAQWGDCQEWWLSKISNCAFECDYYYYYFSSLLQDCLQMTYWSLKTHVTVKWQFMQMTCSVQRQFTKSSLVSSKAVYNGIFDTFEDIFQLSSWFVQKHDQRQ